METSASEIQYDSASAGNAGTARAATANSRAAIRNLANDIHDPHRNHDYLADGLAAECEFYRIERQNGSLNFRILGDPWHGNITPLLAIDLDHQRHGVFDQQIAFDLRPIGLRNQPGLAQHRPALLGQVRPCLDDDLIHRAPRLRSHQHAEGVPRPDFDQRQVRILEEFGRWTGKHAPAIFGSRAGIGFDYFHGPSTLSADGRTLYLFLDGRPNEDVMVKGLDNQVLRARVVGNDAPVAHRVVGKHSWSKVPGLLHLEVPEDALDPVVTVLALELDAPVSLFREHIKPIESN